MLSKTNPNFYLAPIPASAVFFWLPAECQQSLHGVERHLNLNQLNMLHDDADETMDFIDHQGSYEH